MGRLLFLLPILAWAQGPTGSIRGLIVDPAGAPIRFADVRVSSRETSASEGSRNGIIVFRDLSPDWYVISAYAQSLRETVLAVKVEAGKETDASTLKLLLGTCENPFVHCDSISTYHPVPPPIRVLTVCEALEGRDTYNFETVVIVGIFKSGLDETLRQDCPNQLVTGDIGFMSAIALTRPTEPPESLRAEIEKKRAIILASGPPGAHPRPERVTALYGRLVSPAGLTSIPCCTAPVEINAAPARLVGLDERDFRVLR